MRIALDAFGGDNAPAVNIQGALLALEEAPSNGLAGLKIALVGDRKKLEPHLPASIPSRLSVFDSGVIPDDDHSRSGLDGGHESSPIRASLRRHRLGEFDAVVSAGSTASQVTASLIELEKCSGITRPAIGSFLPTTRGASLLLDVGASLSAKPHHLVQFAAMGSVYVREFLGISEPRIGLINVGGEAFVGDRTVVEAHRLLTESGFNYVGFVEGRDIPTGAADVLVTNGFVGNVLLKFAEGVPKLVASLAGGLSDEAKAIIARGLDYNAYGGEPLLGVKGVSIICHGASKDRAIAQGIFQAARIAKMDIHHRIEEFLVDKFASYFSQVKYLGSFRRSLKSSESTESETN